LGLQGIDALLALTADDLNVRVRREAHPDGKSIDPRGREQHIHAAAEGATAPETLRQKGRGSDDNAGKRDSAPDLIRGLAQQAKSPPTE
jgi:hypothetical protein